MFTLFGTAISWKSSQQFVVALSTTEAEYMAITEVVNEAIWLEGLLQEMGINQDCISIFCDNQSAIQLTKHQVYHERTKHIDVRLYFIRDIISEGIIKVRKIHTSDNTADTLTKPLPAGKFKLCRDLMKVCVQKSIG